MQQLPPENEMMDSLGSLVPSSPNEDGDARHHAELELTTVRQMMESLYARFEALQENNAIQFAGVHERLDAVELEVPLIQEQSALRMRDIETRVNAGLEEVRADLQAEVATKLGSLSELFEAQHRELARLQESKQTTEQRLNRAILDLEKLSGNFSHQRPATGLAAPAPVEKLPVEPIPEKPVVRGTGDTGFEQWKKQYMEFNESDETDLADQPLNPKCLTCPRCYSIRIRPATPMGFDRLFSFARLRPLRCRACSHRFYKLGAVVLADPPEEHSVSEASGTKETLAD